MPTSDTLCTAFFDAYAAKMPPPANDQVLLIKDALFEAHFRARLGALFKVSQGDAEETMSSVIDAKRARGWRMAIEERAGMLFANDSNAPPSALLIKKVTGPKQPKSKEGEVKLTKSEKRLAAGNPTVSDIMEQSGGIPEYPINEACFKVFSVDPMIHEAPAGEVFAALGEGWKTILFRQRTRQKSTLLVYQLLQYLS